MNSSSFTFCVSEIVIGQLSIFLLELTLDFIPGAFELAANFRKVNLCSLGSDLVLRSQDFHRVLFWFNQTAVGVRVNLRKFRPKK